MKINGYNKTKDQRYNFESATYKGKSVPKSFWSKLAKKRAIPIILAVAIAGGFGLKTIESIRNPDIELTQTNITEALEENEYNSNDYDELFSLIEEYNNTNSIASKSEIMVKLSEYSRLTEDLILNQTKTTFCNTLNSIENNKKEYLPENIRINISFDKGQGEIMYNITDNDFYSDHIKTKFNSKIFDESMNAIYQLQDRDFKHSYRDQGYDVIKALNCIDDLRNTNFSAIYNEKKDRYELKEEKKHNKEKNIDNDDFEK